MEEFEKEEIMEGVNRHLEYVKQKFPQLKVLGIFVIGSQNYGLSLQTDEYRSNLDTVVVIQKDKDFDGFKTIKIGHKDRIMIYDCSCFYHLLSLASCSQIETLFTEYRIIEDDRLNVLIKNADRIAKVNVYKMLCDILEDTIHQCQGITLNMPHIDKNVYNIFRSYVFARDVFYGTSYRDALCPDSVDTKILLDIKTGRFIEIHGITLQNYAESIKTCAKDLLNKIEELAHGFTVDMAVYDILDEFKKQFK